MNPPPRGLATPRPFRVNRNVRLLYALGLVTQLQPGLAVWVLYLTDFRHLTLAEVGLMELFFWGAKVLMEVPAGAVADRFGRRATFAIGLVIEGTGVTLFAFASSFQLLALSYVLWSSGFSFRSGNDEAYLYDALASEGRAHEFSARNGVLQAMVSVALMSSGIAGAWLASKTTLQVPLAMGVVPFVVAAGVVALLREPPRHASSAEGYAVPRLDYRGTLATAMRALRDNRLLRMALLFQIALTAAFEADILLLQPFLQERGVTMALIGVMQVPPRLANIVGAILSARAARLLGVRHLAGTALGIAVGGLILLAAVDHPAAILGFIGVQFAIGIANPAIGGYLNDRTDSSIRATVLSFVPLGESLAFAVSGPLLGAAAGRSLQLAFGGMAALILATAGPLLVLWRRADVRTARGS